MRRTALYRMFDRHGRLLYVGISDRALMRLTQHRAQKDWYEQIVRIDFEWFATRENASTAEHKAITWENPLHNSHRSRKHRAKLVKRLLRLRRGGRVMGTGRDPEYLEKGTRVYAIKRTMCGWKGKGTVIWHTNTVTILKDDATPYDSTATFMRNQVRVLKDEQSNPALIEQYQILDHRKCRKLSDYDRLEIDFAEMMVK